MRVQPAHAASLLFHDTYTEVVPPSAFYPTSNLSPYTLPPFPSDPFSPPLLPISRRAVCYASPRTHQHASQQIFSILFLRLSLSMLPPPLFRVQSGPRSTAYRLRTNNPRNGTQAYLSAPDSYPSDT